MDWQEQLMVLRGMTAATGVMHTAQQLQLKMWGALAFPFIKKGQWEIQVDLERKMVTYVLGKRKLFSPRPPRDYLQRLEVLHRSVQWLLGGDWLLTVKDGDASVFMGKRKAPDQQVADERKSRVDRQ